HANRNEALRWRVFFCAGDTLPFLAIFSAALIFFCYFFCIKAKKVIRVSEATPRKNSALARPAIPQSLPDSPEKKTLLLMCKKYIFPYLHFPTGKNRLRLSAYSEIAEA
ncbi:MAG: hypothetical protein ABW007_15105, partial [Chitinophagaceae bacterium]